MATNAEVVGRAMDATCKRTYNCVAAFATAQWHTFRNHVLLDGCSLWFSSGESWHVWALPDIRLVPGGHVPVEFSATAVLLIASVIILPTNHRAATVNTLDHAAAVWAIAHPISLQTSQKL